MSEASDASAGEGSADRGAPGPSAARSSPAVGDRRPAEESEYSCAICLGDPEHQVHQCRNGHLFCAECLAECRARSARCPTCRVGLPADPIRNLVAERALARRPAQCPHCKLNTTRGELEHHKRRCPKRVVTCSGCAAGCEWSGPNLPGALKEHEKNCVRAVTRKQLEPLRQRVTDLESQLAAALARADGGWTALHPRDAPLRHRGGLWRVWESDDVFATIALPELSLSSGRWYFEVTVLEEPVFPQLGWARGGFAPDGQVGCGDDALSYAIDGDRCKIWHAGHHSDYGDAWEAGDVVGFLLDLEGRSVGFAINGEELTRYAGEQPEPAFVDISDAGGWFPALTMKSGLVKVNLGGADFEHPPADLDGGGAWNAVALADVYQAPR